MILVAKVKFNGALIKWDFSPSSIYRIQNLYCLCVDIEICHVFCIK